MLPFEKAGRKSGLITKTLNRCRSARARGKLAPEMARFTVCVSSGQQRFVVRPECVNHPLLD
jgi:SAUR family protein